MICKISAIEKIHSKKGEDFVKVHYITADGTVGTVFTGRDNFSKFGCEPDDLVDDDIAFDVKTNGDVNLDFGPTGRLVGVSLVKAK